MPAAATEEFRVDAVAWDDPLAAELRREQETELRQRYVDVLAIRAVPALDPIEPGRVRGFWLATDVGSGEPLGCAALHDPDPMTAGADGYCAAEVKRVYVRAAHRGRGVAARLMTALTSAAVDLGFDRLVLSTGPRQPEAAGLYRKLGWRRIPDYGDCRNVSAVVCFELALWADPPAIADTAPVRHRRSARSLVFDRSDRLLLTRNVVTGPDGIVRAYWALPGGGIEDGEDARAAAMRELAEETGLIGVALAGPVVTQDYWVAFGAFVLHQVEELWWGRTTSDQVSRSGLHPDEDYLVDLRWWTLAELRRTDEVTFPRLLPDLVEALLRHGTPPEPFSIASDSTRPPGRPTG